MLTIKQVQKKDHVAFEVHDDVGIQVVTKAIRPEPQDRMVVACSGYWLDPSVARVYAAAILQAADYAESAINPQ